MTLYFVTGNKGKFDEVSSVLPGIVQLDLDLVEIQSLDPRVIIKAKLEEAHVQVDGEILVEDTSLYFDSMEGLPGPLIKWFIQSLGLPGLYKLARSMGNTKARAVTIFGHLGSTGVASFYAWEVSGEIVAPRGELGFGWDAIFVPEGSKSTFAQMSANEKMNTTNNMRRIALAQFIATRS